MRLSLLFASAVSMASVAQAYTACMLDCMSKAVGPAGCSGTNYNTTACLCLNAQFTSLTRTCFYTACVDDIYPWYNLREAECGSLSSDLTSPQFVPSNGNSTYDKAVAGGSSAISVSSVAVARSSGSVSATGSATASASATSSPAASVVSGAAAAASSSRAAGALSVSLGAREVVLALGLGLGGAVVGGLLVL